MKNQTYLYRHLWSKSERLNEPIKSSCEEEAIQSLIFEADLCEDLESYVRVLCRGMYKHLGCDKLKSVMRSNPKLQDKLERLGLDIIEKSHNESDLFYVGVFADLKLKENWLNREAYRVLSALFKHVLELGLKISAPLRSKLQNKWNTFKKQNRRGHSTRYYQELKYCS